MAKLFCCKVSQNPHKEELLNEITERIFEIDGYHVDEILEGIPFTVYFDDIGVVTNVAVLDDYYKNFLEDNFNSGRFYRIVREYAQKIVDSGDEVDVPSYIMDKYFINGINCAFITSER